MNLVCPVNFIRRHCRVIIAVFFTSAGLFLRFKKLANRDLWCDEIWQLAQTVGSFKPIWEKVHLIDYTCFSGDYFLTYPFVHFLGDSKWAINIPHYFTTLLGFFIFYLICRKYLKTALSFTIGFLILCFNGNLIFHSFEFRPYAVLPTLSLAAFYFIDMIISKWENLSWLKKSLIGIFVLFVVSFHIFGIMIIGSCFIYSIIIETRKPYYGEVIKKMMPFLLCIGFLAFLLFFWHTSGTMWNSINNENTFKYYPDPANDFIHFMRQVFANLMGNKKYGQKFLALGIWIAFLLPHKDRLKQIGFFLVMIVMPILCILMADIYSGYWFLDRQFIWVMPLYAFLLSWCWDSIFKYDWKGSMLMRWLNKKTI